MLLFWNCRKEKEPLFYGRTWDGTGRTGLILTATLLLVVVCHDEAQTWDCGFWSIVNIFIVNADGSIIPTYFKREQKYNLHAIIYYSMWDRMVIIPRNGLFWRKVEKWKPHECTGRCPNQRMVSSFNMLHGLFERKRTIISTWPKQTAGLRITEPRWWVNSKFCVNTELWAQIEQNNFKAGAAQAAAALSIK